MKDRIEKFVQYAQSLDGDEKGEAQVFCDRFFQAFGYDGYKEAGATLEFRVKTKKTTNFADLLWEDRVLIEMKKKGAQLQSHRSQIFDYWWKLRPNQPKYSILCNFNEFVIYDFGIQDEPLDRIKLDDLPDRYTAFNFMLPKPSAPIFENNLEEVTREAANLVAEVFNSLIERGEDRDRAQRFILQCIFTMFAEDYQLLPKDIFTQILIDCLGGVGNSYDLLYGLFSQMNSKNKARGGRFKDVNYFNGGLFLTPESADLSAVELRKLREAASKKWSKVNPAIFGTIFQSSMGAEARHAFGAHFTTELDILKIVQPTIIQPWREKISKAKTLKELKQLRKELASFTVLDPACGSGNFLYVAYRELKRIEMELLNKIHLEFPKSAGEIGTQSIVSIKQFHGIDYNTFAVELAKVTLMLAKEIAIKETQDWVDTIQKGMPFQLDQTLPLDNMDDNIIFGDALFEEWIDADVIIGNPPYQSNKNMQEEYGGEYVNKLHSHYPEVPGRADYCVYWFYKAHKLLKPGGFAGLMGTNTIRQNYSREGGLDYIIKNGGTIFNAVSSQPWSGDAVVFVSIVNWVKGEYEGKKKLYIEDRNGTQIEHEVPSINSSLSLNVDVTKAKVLQINRQPKKVFQGQTHGHSGFLMPSAEAAKMIQQNPSNKDVLKPFLIGRELVSSIGSKPKRYVIDFTGMDVIEASTYTEPFDKIKKTVLPDREHKAKAQEEKNERILKNDPKANINKHHINFFNRWWQLSYGRQDMNEELSKISRFIACSRVSARPIFEFVSSGINPNDSVMVFTYEDDYTFGIIHSSTHVAWYHEKGATLKGDPSYTPNTIWDTFPFPQNPSYSDVKKVASAAKLLREKRREIMQKYNYTLRDIYRLLEEPGQNPLRDLHQSLDDAVLSAYGFNKRKDVLSQLLHLNFLVSDAIKKGAECQAPGLPSSIDEPAEFISSDCVQVD
ncbi:DNA methyltransferase [Phaeodactylibacter xiamenensis]|mgnify:CR=1 FL=1|uniref:DNA methyltransferase n=1 Tax=Phaeodactylibacter xiamenensis TaxID=1524460 RepID=UPI0024A82BF1|nr:DNA methyltransferase [Phaeodactylibacter xiamenensis]